MDFGALRVIKVKLPLIADFDGGLWEKLFLGPNAAQSIEKLTRLKLFEHLRWMPTCCHCGFPQHPAGMVCPVAWVWHGLAPGTGGASVQPAEGGHGPSSGGHSKPAARAVPWRPGRRCKCNTRAVRTGQQADCPGVAVYLPRGEPRPKVKRSRLTSPVGTWGTAAASGGNQPEPQEAGLARLVRSAGRGKSREQRKWTPTAQGERVGARLLVGDDFPLRKAVHPIRGVGGDEGLPPSLRWLVGPPRGRCCWSARGSARSLRRRGVSGAGTGPGAVYPETSDPVNPRLRLSTVEGRGAA